MARPSFDQLKEQFLREVPSDGSAIGNKRLRHKLGWELDKYWQVRDELIGAGVLRLGRGRGGAVSRTTPVEPSPTSVSEEKSPQRETKRERELYPSFRKGLEKWATDEGWTNHLIEQTAHQGRRNTGGNWTRPDFVVLGVKKYEYTPGIVRDVETFEVKPDLSGIEAVFETAAHSRFATKSYLAIHAIPEDLDEERLGRIESECQRFGLGLILFDDPADPETWKYRVEATRNEPDPEFLERFLNEQVEDREKFRKWLR